MKAFLNVRTKLTYGDKDVIRLSIRESLKMLEIHGNAIMPGQSVILKVNILGAFPPEKAVCTNPEIVRCVVEELLVLRVKVTIAEECLDVKAPYVSGILKVAEDLGVNFINLYETTYKSINVNGVVYEYYEELLKSDHLILLPKLKTDVLTHFTGAIKLMYGAIIKKQRVSLHKYTDPVEFARILVDIFSIRTPTITFMDGIVSMEGAGPIHGMPNYSGLLLISNDSVMLDYYASSFMKYDPLKIDMIRLAMERELSLSKPEEVGLIGDNIEGIKNNFALVPIFYGPMRHRFIRRVMGLPLIIEDRCLLCGSCIQSCPYEAISKGEEYPYIDYKKCKLCFCCEGVCENGAVVSDSFISFKQ